MHKQMHKITKESIVTSTTEVVIADAITLKDLLSMTIHGSVLETDSTVETSYIDFDIIFVYRSHVNFQEKVQHIDKLFENLCRGFSHETVHCMHAIKSGPMHPLRADKNCDLIDLNNSQILFFHVSVFDELDYDGTNAERSPSPLLIFGWQKLLPAYGESLKSIKSITELSIDNIVSNGLGIDSCMEMLTSKSRGYWYWVDGDMTWVIEPFTDFDHYEMIVYAYKWCIKNTSQYLSQILPLNQEKCSDEIFEAHLLDYSLYNDYVMLRNFKNELSQHRCNFVRSPDEFIACFDVELMTESVLKILKSVKKKMLDIKKLNNVNDSFMLPRAGTLSGLGEITISSNIKSLMNRAMENHPDKILLLTDINVREWYDLKRWFDDLSLDTHEYILGTEVSEKSPKQLFDVLEYAEKISLTTSSLIVLFGGGSVGNLGGMAAGLYFRGIKFIHVPTTILAQLDSTIGCKQSVNGFKNKNKFGIFTMPESVNINPLLNSTLPKEQKISGLMEAFKHGLCQSSVLLNSVINYDIEHFDTYLLYEIVAETIKLKLEYMEQDPRESLPDQPLELGHKIAHALEFETKETIPHGICVAFGMVAEAQLFFDRGIIDIDAKEYIIESVKKIVPYICIPPGVEPCQISKTVLYDNKKVGNRIPFIALYSQQKPGVVWIEDDDGIRTQLESAIMFAKEMLKNEK